MRRSGSRGKFRTAGPSRATPGATWVVDLAFTGRVEEGIVELRTAIRIADEELDDVDENARALVNLGSALWVAGRVHEAADVALESVRVGDELGLRRRKGVWCRCDAVQMLALVGRSDEAEPLLGEIRELNPQGIDAIRVDLVEGLVRFRQGDLERARHLFERARAAGHQLLDPQLLGPLSAGLAETALDQGDLAGASTVLADAPCARHLASGVRGPRACRRGRGGGPRESTSAGTGSRAAPPGRGGGREARLVPAARRGRAGRSAGRARRRR